MLDVNKKELQEKFKQKDWNYVFDKVYKITDFILSSKYKIYGIESEDIKQECALNFYKKIVQNKVEENNNIFSFIWANSSFRIREILRKQNNRKRKVKFISYDALDVYRKKPEVFMND